MAYTYPSIGMTDRHDRKIIAILLVVFSALVIARRLSVFGEDLSSSYFGCQVLASGDAGHLYSHDPAQFNVITDPLWTGAAVRAGFKPLSLLHRYVQTPLWAYSLRPLCTHMSFPAFNKLFIGIVTLCFSGMIWLVARYWTPRLMHVGWIGLIWACLYVSEPMKYALFLTQTHIIYLLLTAVALICARRNHPVWAGVLLALAAAVKITPGFLVLYWLLTKQQKAALSFAVSSAALGVMTLLVTGPAVTLAYLRELSELSHVLLVAFNNQSLAAWWMGHSYPATDLFFWNIYRLPTAVWLASLLLCLACTVGGGLLDRRAASLGAAPLDAGLPPYGAVFAMVGATVFTPIAWTHYYVVLLLPLMLMLDGALRRRSALLVAFIVAVFGLNLYPVAFQAVSHHFRDFSVVRSQFYAGVLSLAGLAFLYAREMRERRLYGGVPEPQLSQELVA